MDPLLITALIDLIPKLGALGARIATVVNNSPEVTETDKLKLRQRMAAIDAKLDELDRAADSGNA